jgi:hypothetical protein
MWFSQGNVSREVVFISFRGFDEILEIGNRQRGKSLLWLLVSEVVSPW